MAKDVPVGFTQIRMRLEISSTASQSELDRLRELTERYCVVYQTLRSGPPIEMKLVRA